MQSLFMKESSSSEFEQYTRTTATADMKTKYVRNKVQVYGFLAANDLNFIFPYAYLV